MLNINFLVLALCGFASSFAWRLADPIVLALADGFSVDLKAAALITTAYALPYSLCQPFLGPLGDRIGKESLMRLCVTVMAVALLLGSVAPTFEALIGTRVIAGIAAGGITPLVLAIIGDRFDLSERQVAIGRILVALIGGQMAGAAVSGAMNDAFGWRSVFVAAGLIGVAASACAWGLLRVPASDARASRRSVVELYGAVFAQRTAWWLLSLVFVEGLLFFGFLPFMGELMQSRAASSAGVGSTETGWVLGAYGLGGILYALSVRWLLVRLGMRGVASLGAVLSAACLAVIAMPGSWQRDAVAMLALGTGFYMIHNSMQTVATELAPSARASAVALFACAYFLGQAMGPLMFGPAAHGAGFAAALLAVAAGVVGLGVAFVWLVARR